MTTTPDTDNSWMKRALALARAQLGKTAPNPSVGCVIVADGENVGEAATGDGGRPHAEEAALIQAGARASGATAYVTLEPCSKRSSGGHGCAQRLIDAGVKRVVFACADPHPDARDGVVMLTDAGVEVEANVLKEDAEALNRGFFKRLETGQPLLAVAASPDTYDAEFDLKRNESFEDALDRLGTDGMTRVWVRAGTPLAAQLVARGLVDEADEQAGPK